MTIRPASRPLPVVVGSLLLVLCLVTAGCGADPIEPVDTGAVEQGSDTGSGDSEAVSAAEIPATAQAVPTITAPIEPPTTTTSAPTTTTTVPPWSIPEAQARQVEVLMAVIESIRGRSFERRPDFETSGDDGPAALHPSGLGVTEGEVPRHQLVFLALVGLAPADAASPGTGTAVREAPIREPFYDFERAVVVLPGAGEPLDEYQQWVLVGELAHALTHQHEPLLVDSILGAGKDQDRTAARIALLEGEAVLVQSLYLDSLPEERRGEVARQAGERSSPVLREIPSVLRDLTGFPYRAGSFLVTELYRLGGMPAIDQALGRPPDTTEHVFHLDRYRRQEPAVVVEPPDVSADGYVVVEQGTWGERRWRTLLEYHSGAVGAARAAEGWGGDRYLMLWDRITGGVVFVVRYAGDSFADESEMITAIRDLVTSGMDIESSRVVDTVTEWVEGRGYAMLAWDVGRIVLVLASDPQVGRSVVSQLGIVT